MLVNPKKLSAEKVGPIVTPDTLKLTAEEVVSTRVGRGRPTMGVTKGGFSEFFLSIFVNASESSVEIDGLVMTMGTSEPTEEVVSTGIEKDTLTMGIAKDCFSNSSLLISVNVSEPSVEKDGFVITRNTPELIERVVFVGLVE